ncbi:MAG: hypothetical protein M1824_002743 [Vezdaea acicularis]|nr:MAG: hypothetical protein M1824_002743 [Vezdaea acicularis]
MGWWREPSPAKDAAIPLRVGNDDVNETANTSDDSRTPTRPKTLSRDQQAELELQELFESLAADSSNQARPQKSAQPPENYNASWDISADSLFPSQMSCREAFDSAFYCQSLGGQFNNVYRHGGLRNCSEHWGNFWFCMRTKGHSEPQKSAMIRNHYRKRAAKYKTGPSSEDVWKVRTEPLEGAFQKPIPEEREESESSHA